MRRLRQFGVLVLLVATGLAPAMACMIPGAQMTTEERACCRMMQNRCGEMAMPASHSCCQKTQHNSLDKALVTKALNSHLVTVTAVRLAVNEGLQPAVTVEWIDRPNDSPPQFPPGSNSVLRI